MATTIDYNTYTINVLRADMTLIASSPTEIRQLDINAFRVELNGLMEHDDGMPFPTNHEHTPPLTISGVTLARVVEVLSPYTITFEDGLYNVNIVGGNSNISDVVNKNQVGVNTANSAGLQDPFTLQAGAFANEVTINASSSYSGTIFPIGTRGYPVNNLADAQAIALLRGIGTFRVIGSLTITSGDYSEGFCFCGDSPEVSEIVLESAANLSNCSFRGTEISGVMDGSNMIRDCHVGAITMFHGAICGSCVAGPVSIGAGTTTQILDCYSDTAESGDPTAFPVIDMGGVGSSDLILRNWSGGVGVQNLSDATVLVSADMLSGAVYIYPTVTAGKLSVRGIAFVLDSSTGAADVLDATLTRTSSTGGIR